VKNKSDNTNFPISKILVKDNIRDKGWDKCVSELADSIKQVGLISPVLIMPLSKPVGGKTHELVYGFRRFAAHKKLKFSTIKVTFAPKDMTQKQKDTARLVENTEREDLSPLEEARAYKAMMETHKLSAKQVAKTVSKTDGHISQRLALLRMPKKVITAVESGALTATHARQLHRLKDPKEQEKLITKAAGMTAQAFEAFVEQKLHPEKKEKKGKKAKDTPTDKHQSRKKVMQALKKLDIAKAKAKNAGNKEKTAHLNGVIRGLSWTLKVKGAKLPI
jgi:ParB family chromosome partitioning protein